MRFETLKRIVLAKPKATFTHIVWERELPVRKTFPGVTVVKRTSGTIRMGIDYNNMASVQLKRMSGELPSENAGLGKNREWIEYPYFIQGKNRCLRIYLDKKNKLSSVYFINGVRATKEQAMMYCTKEAFPSNPKKSDVLDINVDNIISIK